MQIITPSRNHNSHRICLRLCGFGALQMKQGPRPDVETGLQCHCSKTDADASNCTTELLHNHLAGSTERIHSEDNGTARPVVVAVSQPAETRSSPGKDGTLLSARRRKALGKVLAVALAACLLGAVLVLSVYLLGESTVPVHECYLCEHV